MHLMTQSESFTLCDADIDAFSEWLNNILPDAGLDRKNCLRVRLLAEELLLRLQEHLGTETPFSASLNVRFKRAALRIEAAGAAFNPLGETAQALGGWNSSLLTAVGLSPRYSYIGEKNILRLPLPQKHMNPVLKMHLFLLAGIVLGVLGLWLLPQDFRETYCGEALTPAFEIWSRILNAASGPIIFFMALTTILNTSSINRQGGSSTRVIGRYLVITFLMIAAALTIAAPFFSAAQIGKTAPTLPWQEMISDLFPSNIVDPLLKSNTPQLLLLATALATALIAADDHAKRLRRGVREINVIGSLLARGLSQMIPFVAGLFLCLEIWNRRVQILIGMWKPLALSFGVAAMLALLMLLWFSVRMRVGLFTAVKKLWKPFWLALCGAPVDETIESAETVCASQLGIDRGFAKICLPQGMVLFMPISAVGTLIFTLYLLNVYQIHLDTVWLVITVLLIEFLFVATPPVPGANLLAFAAMFSWLSIPGEAILDAMIFDILFGYLASAANLTLLQTETAQQAKRLGFLQLEILRRPYSEKTR